MSPSDPTPTSDPLDPALGAGEGDVAARVRMFEQLCRVQLEFALRMQISLAEARAAFDRASMCVHETPYRLSEAIKFQTLLKVSDILGLWYRDPAWLEEDGLPAPLPLEGRRSFATLVAEFLPGFAPAAIAQELIQIEILIQGADGLVVPRRRVAGGPAFHGWMLDRIPALSRGLFGTLSHNVTAKLTGTQTHCERGTMLKVPVSRVSAFLAETKRRAQQLINDMDEWGDQQVREAPAEPRLHLGVQVFSHGEHTPEAGA